jgi:hypothetical protein
MIRRSDTIRTTIIGLAIGCLTLAGCSSSPASSADDSPSPTSTSTTTTGAESQVSSSAATPPEPSQAADTPPSGEDAAPIGPDGIGQLLLGMPFQEAKDAGFVRGKEEPDCASYDMYLGGERYGLVYISADRGVEAIGPERPVRTPEDVTMGTPAAQVAKIYPDFDVDQLSELDHALAKVPGHPQATYRLAFRDHKAVTGISLQMTDQHCYE